MWQIGHVSSETWATDERGRRRPAFTIDTDAHHESMPKKINLGIPSYAFHIFVLFFVYFFFGFTTRLFNQEFSTASRKERTIEKNKNVNAKNRNALLFTVSAHQRPP
jgi:hypothetical protein